MEPILIDGKDPTEYLKTVVRSTLEGLEDSIIFDLFERARFKRNKALYLPETFDIKNFGGSFFDFLLRGTEEVHGSAGRYLDVKEHPFTQGLEYELAISREKEETIVRPVEINVNGKIRAMYFRALNKICEEGDEKSSYGGTAVCDIRSLQDLSKRVHFGMFVAETKFRQDPEKYVELINAGDVEGIVEKLTDKNIERTIIERVGKKGEDYHMNPELIANFYKNEIIPLTIGVEVEYFMQRGFD